MSFSVTLDAVQYAMKPTGELTLITWRMQKAGHVELDEAAFCEAVRRGQTWCGGCYEPSSESWGAFVSQQLFALDFDNDVEVIVNGKKLKDANGKTVKRALRPDEAGYLDPVDALDRCDPVTLQIPQSRVGLPKSSSLKLGADLRSFLRLRLHRECAGMTLAMSSASSGCSATS